MCMFCRSLFPHHDINELLLKVALKTITITTINDEAGILGSGEVHDASVEAIPPRRKL